METFLRIRISGENISPSKIRTKDLADLINSTEDMTISQIGYDHPEVNRDEISISLIEVNTGSAEYKFSTSNPDLFFPAMEKISTAIISSNFENISTTTIEKIKILKNFSKKTNGSIELATVNGKTTIYTVITHETKIIPPAEISGRTILYGRLIRIGGKNKAMATLELPDNITISCEIGIELAKQLAPRIYTWVGLIGNAKWRISDRSITSFKVTEISEYRDVPLSESFHWLKEMIGDYFNEVDDPNEFIRQLRSGGGE